MALSWLKNKFDDVSKSLKDEVTKIKNQTFLEGVVAGCTIVAYADGVVSSEEKQKMMGFMRSNDVLSVFDTAKVIQLFEKGVSKYEFDRSIGEMEALAVDARRERQQRAVVGKLRSKPAEARLLVRVCCAIGASDGNFDATEKQAVVRICNELGLSASEFDL